MKPMRDKSFLDTNVLIYCYTFSEPEKRSLARTVANKPNTIISVQVVKEFVNVLNKKFKKDWPSIQTTIEELDNNFNIKINTANSVSYACYIADRYGFSFYDSLIVAAAIESDCTILYSEDMQHGQIIEKTLVIQNPFL